MNVEDSTEYKDVIYKNIYPDNKVPGIYINSIDGIAPTIGFRNMIEKKVSICSVQGASIQTYFFNPFAVRNDSSDFNKAEQLSMMSHTLRTGSRDKVIIGNMFIGLLKNKVLSPIIMAVSENYNYQYVTSESPTTSSDDIAYDRVYQKVEKWPKDTTLLVNMEYDKLGKSGKYIYSYYKQHIRNVVQWHYVIKKVPEKDMRKYLLLESDIKFPCMGPLDLHQFCCQILKEKETV